MALERGEGSASRPGCSLPPWKDPVPIVQEAGWAPGPVWTGVENLAPTGIWSPDRTACSQSLYWLRYLDHTTAECSPLIHATICTFCWQTHILNPQCQLIVSSPQANFNILKVSETVLPHMKNLMHTHHSLTCHFTVPPNLTLKSTAYDFANSTPPPPSGSLPY